MLENLSLAFQGIWSHKLRSFLTMLGIIIGIASIFTIVSTIRGTNEQIKENLIGAGTNAVTVDLTQNGWTYYIAYNGLPEGVTTISDDTLQQLKDIKNVEEVSLYCYRENYDADIYYLDTAFTGYLYGIDESFFSASGYDLVYGRDFVEKDHSDIKKVVILDTTAASTLFSNDYPIGKALEINGDVFTVVGVVEKTRTADLQIETYADYWTYADTTGGGIFIPLEAWPIVGLFDEPQTVVLRAASTDDMTSIGQQASDLLTATQIVGNDDTFTYDSEDLMAQAEELQALSTSTSRQLIWIASIALLVGGIGVMNIMLVTVTERTREIGLKKAIGARKRRILWQFLTEAAVLTCIGGILGVVAGIGFSKIVSTVSGTPTAISIGAIVLAVVFSLFIGILFGMLPAVKASNLNPIDALRRE